VKAVSDTLGVSRSNLHERVSGRTKPRRRYHKAQDAALLPLIERLVAKRPSYGYRRITAVLNRKLRTDGLAPVNHKRVYRIMKAHNLLLAGKYTERPEQTHDGKVVVTRSNLRSPVGLNQWRLTGSLFRRLRVHLLERRRGARCTRPLFLNQWRTRSRSSMRMIARSSRGMWW
jgi:hypothetical protein